MNYTANCSRERELAHFNPHHSPLFSDQQPGYFETAARGHGAAEAEVAGALQERHGRRPGLACGKA